MDGLTHEALQRIQEYLADAWWRMCNLYWIKPKDGPLEKFTPTPEQTELWHNLWFRNSILKARQLGFSTLICLIILDRCLFNKDHAAAIIDKGMPEAKKKLAIIKRAWDNLDNPACPIGRTVGKFIKERIKLITDSKEELVWSNGSSVYAAVSARGGTLNFLHISELAWVAAHAPGKAEEIMSGGVPGVGASCVIVSESTHEGGPFGVHYNLVKQAMDMVGRELSPLDWRFHWFPWQTSMEYRMDCGEIEAELIAYFDQLEQTGIILEDEQMRFYSAMYRTLKHRVKTEYPSTPDEALAAISAGSIYGDIMSVLRVKGRVTDFELDKRFPLFCFWDLGQGDSTVLWLIQILGQQVLFVDWFEHSGKAVSFYAAKVREWNDKHTYITHHFLPHDATTRDKGAGISWVQHMNNAGIHNITTVPRTMDIWAGINVLRELLPRAVFHKRCDVKRSQDGVDYPSGVACLEMYHREVDVVNGRISEKPVHDWTSHTADAARTFAEAWHKGLVQPHLTGESTRSERRREMGKPGAIMGFSHSHAPSEDEEFWSDIDKGANP